MCSPGDNDRRNASGRKLSMEKVARVEAKGQPGRGERPETGAKRRTKIEEHTSELQSHSDLVCRLLLEKKKTTHKKQIKP